MEANQLLYFLQEQEYNSPINKAFVTSMQRTCFNTGNALLFTDFQALQAKT